ncbi:[FeFe] hydrogenase H-cluster maturation GTPase HydF [Clostridiales Family XIII bacterium PM5-7]
MEKETLGFNQTPSANRIHISFFGRRNAGKSSVVNAVTGQALSIVSEIKGTTTDPVKKAMELLPLGPVVIIDTPGIDDEGVIGEKRIEKTFNVLNMTDVAVLVVDNFIGPGKEDLALVDLFKKKNIPFIVALNKVDLDMEALVDTHTDDYPFPFIHISAVTGQGIEALKEAIGQLVKPLEAERKILGDFINAGDLVVLVTPIDISAPKGRLILPQVQTLRDALDAHCTVMVTQLSELGTCLNSLNRPPALVVTDSQVFGKVNIIVPDAVPLTSFSILFARFKGILDTAVKGAKAAERLQDGDIVLISEGCTHHRQCEDIGTVKLPNWIEDFSGKKLNFQFTSGTEFPDDLSPFALIVHCGGCMINEREMLYRMNCAKQQEVPFTNYGTLIAHINGILDRSIEIFNGQEEK